VTASNLQKWILKNIYLQEAASDTDSDFSIVAGESSAAKQDIKPKIAKDVKPKVGTAYKHGVKRDALTDNWEHEVDRMPDSGPPPLPPCLACPVSQRGPPSRPQLVSVPFYQAGGRLGSIVLQKSSTSCLVIPPPPSTHTHIQLLWHQQSGRKLLCSQSFV